MSDFTDHIIDKAARALQRLTWRGPLPAWEDTPAHIQDALREDASAILSAVADDLRAEVARAIRDTLVSSLDIPTGPIQTGAMTATAGWAQWITETYNLPPHEETNR